MKHVGSNCAAPPECVRQSPAARPCGKRLRRRGPRGLLALLRRSLPRRCRSLPGMSSGESGDTIPDTQLIHESPNESCNQSSSVSSCTRRPRISRQSCEGISVLTVNIQSVNSAHHLAQLSHQLNLHRPHVVLIQETWLDKSTESVNIPGYTEVSRRDRSDGPNRGGILILQRDDFNGLVKICNCETEERSWHFLRLGVETILLASWYRPGASEHDGFVNLHRQVGQYFQVLSGVFLAGDLNVHHRKWLRFSNGNTTIGDDLKSVCEFYGLFQLVREPTREDYLLDLVLTNISPCTVSVLPAIADHKSVLTKLPVPEVLEVSIKREVWILAKANWKSLSNELLDYDWKKIDHGSAEDSLILFLEILWLHLVKHIPRKVIETKKSSHPWLNDRCKSAIDRKNAAEGTMRFKTESAKCVEILNEERASYVQRVKTKLVSLPRKSK